MYHMLVSDLKAILEDIGINQSDFARLIGVTPRAVTLWMGDERAIPGPAEAYIRLLQTLPANLRQHELARLKGGRNNMRDGMYGVQFGSVSGAGLGVIILDSGRAYGADAGGCKYDGTYIYNEQSEQAELELKLTFAANAQAVFGIKHPYEWSINVKTTLNPRVESGNLRILTTIGPPVEARYNYLRPLPDV
jgi:transcriptional regulator with XRE-family HTH domain